MQKQLFLYLFSIVSAATFSQTILVSQNLNLQKNSSHHQIYTTQNTDKEIFNFVSDKDSLFVFQYNSAIFLKQKTTIARPDKSYIRIVGNQFDFANNPIIYWASEDYMKILQQTFNLEKKVTAQVETRLQFKDETLLTSFNFGNNFYLVSNPKNQQKLKFYIFSERGLTEKFFDFDGFQTATPFGKITKFSTLFQDYPFDIVEPKMQQPLLAVLSPIKIYTHKKNELVLTIDQPSQTQVFLLNFENDSIIEKTFAKDSIERTSLSNSFLHQNTLYQVKTNSKKLVFQAYDFTSGTKLNHFEATESQEISFKNSDLISQTGQKRPVSITKTKKFLRRLSSCDVGISVYQTPNHRLVTIGGARDIASPGGVFAGITIGILGVASGSADFYADDFLYATNLQTNYFETLFDDNFNHLKVEQKRLASDDYSAFLGQNRIDAHTYIPYKDYFVMTYFDVKMQQLVMRKFEDYIE
ncbi:hypothetical protein GV828_07335 [Flavobacterium sp. NST-5]|uniref:Uncharacterized protein n=1 Tax=Flavobacterium ichthyis TaxID=2698827 RepID=A0ABW9ZD46_9FLAO|nr:hypothetical protein [Flavobacterium ichthyis]NBL65010.1 hypothetical protein [Flavobacterium ichthyis]